MSAGAGPSQWQPAAEPWLELGLFLCLAGCRLHRGGGGFCGASAVLYILGFFLFIVKKVRGGDSLEGLRFSCRILEREVKEGFLEKEAAQDCSGPGH